MPALLWLRRDLRRTDHPALAAAADDGPVLPLFVLDPAIFDSAGDVRRAWLAATLGALNDSYDGRLCLRQGAPAEVLPEVAREVGAERVGKVLERARHVDGTCSRRARRDGLA